MPTYEYRCKECGDELEVVQSFSDDPLDTCPSCGGPLRKVFAAPGISFKGSGFYKTDSKGGASSTASSNGTSGEKSDKSDKSGDASGAGSTGSESSGTKESTKDSGSSSSSSGSTGGAKDPSSSTGTKAPTPA
jgi:putative FmdB family regulatory protein